MGLVKPDAGRILLDGDDITGLPMYRRAILGLGYLPQETSIFRGLTVGQNIGAVLELVEPDAKVRAARLDSLLAEFHLDHLRDAAAMALSGGERRRCEIARALAADPSIMLLDEPFAGIDPISIADIRDLVCELKKRDIGVLITDHNVRETLDIVDRACIIYGRQGAVPGQPRGAGRRRECPPALSGRGLLALASGCAGMGLGPRLDLRQSQSLVMTPQLQQAIKLLALSNLEIEAFIAEELDSNPLLEASAEEREAQEAPDSSPDEDYGEGGDEPATADRLIEAGDAAADQPLDVDYDSETFHHDSAADSARGLDGGLGLDAATSGGFSEDGPDLAAIASDISLHDHLHAQAGAVLSGRELLIAGHLIDQIDEAGYLAVGLLEVAQRLGAPLALVEQVLGVIPRVRPDRRGRAVAGRMRRASGARGRPAGSGDGAAAGQSRPAGARRAAAAAANLRRRTRRIWST